jgi:hypothetical protein
MGKYINNTGNGPMGVSYEEKITALVQAGAEEIPTPTEFQENLVCVVNNGMFAAAAHLYEPKEMNRFLQSCGRPKKWFIWDEVAQYAK